MSRLGHSQALLGSSLFKQIRETPILVVGAGGIGCELLKNLVLVGFANIEIIDLDTIDLSNLNRQFLFRKPDIKKSKALVAAASARHFNPSSGIKIHARHGNVKDEGNDIEWIKGFGLVLNALDNMDARQHVNRLCQAAGVPLMESGTAGYLGQVSTILRDETECFVCVPKVPPKSFPVCTIRATPSEPIHCIVWAKSYLFGKIFGEDDEAVDEAELDKAQAGGENAEEIDNLKKEAAAFRAVRQQIGAEGGARQAFHKVFVDDINRLLAMEDMWKGPGRVKPVALDYDAIMEGSFVTPPLRTAAAASTAPATGKETNGAANSEAESSAASSSSAKANGVNGAAKAPTAGQLRDQKELSVKENLDLFADSCRRLSARSTAHPNDILSFDKDDDDTLDFVLATANLRAIAYGIPTRTRFQVKEMAGNIIPAIATTNAIIAGAVVMQATKLLSRNISKFRNVYIRNDPTKPFGRQIPAKPDPKCSVCRDAYVPLKVDTAKCTLGTFVNEIIKEWLVKDLEDGDDLEWEIFEGGRLLADPDFDDNYEKTLAELSITRGKTITVQDEDRKYRPVQFCLTNLSEDADKAYELPGWPPSLPVAPPKPVVKEDSPDEIEQIEAFPAESPKPATMSGTKRGAPEDEEVDGAKDDVAKRRRTQADDGVIVID